MELSPRRIVFAMVLLLVATGAEARKYYVSPSRVDATEAASSTERLIELTFDVSRIPVRSGFGEIVFLEWTSAAPFVEPGPEFTVQPLSDVAEGIRPASEERSRNDSEPAAESNTVVTALDYERNRGYFVRLDVTRQMKVWLGAPSRSGRLQFVITGAPDLGGLELPENYRLHVLQIHVPGKE